MIQGGVDICYAEEEGAQSYVDLHASERPAGGYSGQLESYCEGRN